MDAGSRAGCWLAALERASDGTQIPGNPAPGLQRTEPGHKPTRMLHLQGRVLLDEPAVNIWSPLPSHAPSALSQTAQFSDLLHLT